MDDRIQNSHDQYDKSGYYWLIAIIFIVLVLGGFILLKNNQNIAPNNVVAPTGTLNQNNLNVGQSLPTETGQPEVAESPAPTITSAVENNQSSPEPNQNPNGNTGPTLTP